MIVQLLKLQESLEIFLVLLMPLDLLKKCNYVLSTPFKVQYRQMKIGIRQMKIGIRQMKIGIRQMKIEIRQMKIEIRQMKIEICQRW
jgi:hypothetical protein